MLSGCFGLRVNSNCQVEIKLNDFNLPAPHKNHETGLVTNLIVTPGQDGEIYFSFDEAASTATEALACVGLFWHRVERFRLSSLA